MAFTMISKYSSTCKNCGGAIRANVDRIIKINGVWQHELCGSNGSNGTSETTQAAAPAVETPARPFVPSKYQQAIADFMQNASGNAVVEAVAGSGKTTTLVWALQFTPANADVAFVAFNKSIAQELSKRAPKHVSCSTLHSLGFSNLRNVLGNVRVNENKLSEILDVFIPLPRRNTNKAERAAALVTRGMMTKLVSLAKATLVDALDVEAVNSMCDRYGIDLNGDGEKLVNMLPLVLEACKSNAKEVDFDDMLWLPVVFKLADENGDLTREFPCKRFDWLFIDETQDLNACQIAFVLKSIKPGGRIIAVGDRNQSLYGFRGADCDAIPNIISALSATVLPLSITYRCPLSHVKLAQQVVPYLEARENAPEGEVLHIGESKLSASVHDGDMVICRVNAPLVGFAFTLIRNGVKAVVRGRDIGKSLADLARKIAANGDQYAMPNISAMDAMYQALNDYQTREMTRLEAKNASETTIQALTDKVETLSVVMAECNAPDQVADKIESIFSDETAGVVLSSVHRAKGLEAERVYIVRPDLLPHPKAKREWEVQQEQNCLFVALTRSKNTLVFVEKED